MYIKIVFTTTLFPEMCDTNIQHSCLSFGGKSVGKSSPLIQCGVTLFSDFAVRGQLSQGMDDIGEGRALFEAQRPAARHQLVYFGGTSVWNRKLQLPSLQSWRHREGD